MGKTHSVQDLLLSVPFISTLADKKEVRVEPRLAFTLEGSRFDSSAQSTPFAQTRHADAHIRWDDLDLAPYLGYLPASLPIQLKAATLDVDVKLAFEQTPRLAVKLGQVQTRDVKMTDREGQDLLAFDRLTVDMADVRPLEQVVAPGPGRTAQARTARPARCRRAAEPGTTGRWPSACVAPEGSRLATRQVIHQSRRALGSERGARQRCAMARCTGVTRPAQPAAALQARGLGLELTNLALPLQKPVAFKGDFVLPAVAAPGRPGGQDFGV